MEQDNVVRIFDTTLRDGEQAPGNAMTPEEKLRLARQLDALGVDVIEAGFPAASDGDFHGVRAVAEEVRRPALAALARCHDRDIDLAGEALAPAARPRVHVFIATSDIHLKYKLRIDRDECLERARAAIRSARRFTDDVEFSAEDASRTELDFLCRVIEAAIAEGATTINLPDTVGYALPVEYGAMFRAVRERVPDARGVALSCHCHDDLGLAVANSLAAVEAGATQVECTVNGIGARAGYDLDEQALEGLYREFTALADRKHEILDEDLLALLHESFRDVPEAYQLTFLRVSCGMASATAEVALAGPWHRERSGSGTGDGPIAATYHAIGEVVGRSVEVVNLSLRSVTPGKDSVGHVFVQVLVDGKTLTGHGASTDIVEASARALVHALNKADHADKLEATSLNSVYLWGV